MSRLGYQASPGRGLARRGATVVEFAMTVPILLALVWGSIEVSRANMLLHTASIAATEAARQSMLPGATAEDIKARGMRELALAGITDAAFEITPTEIVEDTTQVTVDLTVPVTMKNGYVLPRLFLGKEVFKSVTLQREGKSEDVAKESAKKEGTRDDKSKKDKEKKDKD
jgi:hypothetical protein